MIVVKDKSVKVREYGTRLEWSSDENRYAVCRGYVITSYGIVAVTADFRTPGGYTCFEFAHMGRLYVREYSGRVSSGTAGRAARKFAKEIVEANP